MFTAPITTSSAVGNAGFGANDPASVAQAIRSVASTGPFTTNGRADVRVMALEFGMLQARDPELAAAVRGELTGFMSATELRAFEQGVAAHDGENQSVLFAKRTDTTTIQNGAVTRAVSTEVGLYEGRASKQVSDGPVTAEVGSETTIMVARAKASGTSGPNGAALSGEASSTFAKQKLDGEIALDGGPTVGAEVTGEVGKVEAALKAHIGKVGCENGLKAAIKAEAVAAGADGKISVEIPVKFLSPAARPIVGDTTVSVDMKGGVKAGAAGGGAGAEAILNTCTDRAHVGVSGAASAVLGADVDVRVGIGKPRD